MSEFLNPDHAKRVADIKAAADPRATATAEPTSNRFDRESKLLSHLDRIVEWKEKGTTIPINVVIDPTFKCNHRCPHCSGIMGQDLSTIPITKLEPILDELGALGVRAINLGSGGDPSCHPHLAEILYCIKKNGMETGYYTNGELLKDKTIEATIDACSWVRFSLDADGPEMHQLIHAASPKAFDKVVNNIRRMVEERNRRRPEIVLGAGFLVRPDTMMGMVGATKLCRDLGLDYIRIRPFFGYDNQPLCNAEDAETIVEELEKCREMQSDTFEVNAPATRMDWVETGIPTISYKRCNIHHFSTHIGGDLKVYLCCHTIGWEKYCLGDLNEQTFEEVWFSEKRRKIYENIDYRDCATPCSVHTFNQLLHKFEADTEHTNFL